MTHGNGIHIFRSNGILGRRERRSAGERAGEQTHKHCHKLLGIAFAAPLAYEIAGNAGNTAGDDEKQTQNDIGFEILF